MTAEEDEPRGADVFPGRRPDGSSPVIGSLGRSIARLDPVTPGRASLILLGPQVGSGRPTPLEAAPVAHASLLPTPPTSRDLPRYVVSRCIHHPEHPLCFRPLFPAFVSRVRIGRLCRLCRL